MSTVWLYSIWNELIWLDNLVYLILKWVDLIGWFAILNIEMNWSDWMICYIEYFSDIFSSRTKLAQLKIIPLIKSTMYYVSWSYFFVFDLLKIIFNSFLKKQYSGLSNFMRKCICLPFLCIWMYVYIQLFILTWSIFVLTSKNLYV